MLTPDLDRKAKLSINLSLSLSIVFLFGQGGTINSTMMTFYSSGVLILLLVNYAVQQEGGDNVLPGLTRAWEDEAEGGRGQTTWTLKNEELDNFPGTPVLLDHSDVLANLGGDDEKKIAATAAAADDGKQPAAGNVVGECQIDDSSPAPAPSRNRRRQNNSDKPLICPAQPPQRSPQQEGKKTNPVSSGSQSMEEDPWQFENQERSRTAPRFNYNNGICSGRVYGSERVIPVCDSGIEFFRTYRFLSKDWDLSDVRPCRSK